MSLARDPVCRWGTLPGETGPCRAPSTDVDQAGDASDHLVSTWAMPSPRCIRFDASTGSWQGPPSLAQALPRQNYPVRTELMAVPLNENAG